MDIDFEMEIWKHQREIHWAAAVWQGILFLALILTSRSGLGQGEFGIGVWGGSLLLCLILAGPTLMFSLLTNYALWRVWTFDRVVYTINKVVAVLGMLVGGFFSVVYWDSVQNDPRAGREELGFLKFFLLMFFVHLSSLLISKFLKYVQSI